MQISHLTAPELSFVAGIVTAYRLRRIRAVAKSIRKSPSGELESLSLATIISKLESLSTALSTEEEKVKAIDLTILQSEVLEQLG